MDKEKKAMLDEQLMDLLIPKYLENLQLPNPELLTQYKNLNERTLWLDMDVADGFLEFGKYIMMWNKEDIGIDPDKRKPIYLCFFSPGGSLEINNAMIDLIEASKTPVIGVNIGVAYSAGCLMYLACHKRYAMPSATFLIHKGSGNFSGTYDEIIANILEYQRQIADMESYIMKKTKITEKMLEEKFGSEWFISADEAKELGVCDEIITCIEDIFKG